MQRILAQRPSEMAPLSQLMTGARSFHEWMSELLTRFDLTPPTIQEQEVYTFHFDGKPDIHFIKSAKNGYVDVMAEADVLPNVRAADKLLGLLALNACNAADYTVAVSIQQQSGAVLVWARQRWEILDLPAAATLLQCVRDKSDAVRSEIRKQALRAPANAASALSRTLMAGGQKR